MDLDETNEIVGHHHREILHHLRVIRKKRINIVSAKYVPGFKAERNFD